MLETGVISYTASLGACEKCGSQLRTLLVSAREKGGQWPDELSLIGQMGESEVGVRHRHLQCWHRLSGGIRMGGPSAAALYTYVQERADVASDPAEMGGPSAAAVHTRKAC